MKIAGSRSLMNLRRVFQNGEVANRHFLKGYAMATKERVNVKKSRPVSLSADEVHILLCLPSEDVTVYLLLREYLVGTAFSKPVALVDLARKLAERARYMDGIAFHLFGGLTYAHCERNGIDMEKLIRKSLNRLESNGLLEIKKQEKGSLALRSLPLAKGLT